MSFYMREEEREGESARLDVNLPKYPFHISSVPLKVFSLANIQNYVNKGNPPNFSNNLVPNLLPKPSKGIK